MGGVRDRFGRQVGERGGVVSTGVQRVGRGGLVIDAGRTSI